MTGKNKMLGCRLYFLTAMIFLLFSQPAGAGYQFIVGAPRVFYHDTELERVGDSFFFCENKSVLVCYTGNCYTRIFIGSNLDNMILQSSYAIGPGSDGQLDECGAWLSNVHEIDSKVIGFYHGEHDCVYSGDGMPITKMAMFYAESFDGGMTFLKPDNNLIASNEDSYTLPDRTTGRGIGSVVMFKDKLLMAVIDVTSRGWVTEIATADINNPTTFVLDSTGNSAVNGTGANTTFVGSSLAIHKKGTRQEALLVAFHKGLPELSSSQYDANADLLNTGSESDLVRVAVVQPELIDSVSEEVVNNLYTYPIPYGGIGFIYYDDENKKFRDVEMPPLVYGTNQDWIDRDNGELFLYPSIVGFDGSTPGGKAFSDKFYLTYTYQHIGEDFRYRRIIYQPVEVANDPDLAGNEVKTLLSEYRHWNSLDLWVTTKLPKDGYVRNQNIGYIYTEGGETRVPLHEYETAAGIHFLTTTMSESFGKFIRFSGWIEKHPTEKAQSALIRRYDPVNKRFYHIVKKEDLSLRVDDVLLGYIEGIASEKSSILKYIPALIRK